VPQEARCSMPFFLGINGKGFVCWMPSCDLANSVKAAKRTKLSSKYCNNNRIAHHESFKICAIVHMYVQLCTCMCNCARVCAIVHVYVQLCTCMCNCARVCAQTLSSVQPTDRKIAELKEMLRLERVSLVTWKDRLAQFGHGGRKVIASNVL